MKKIWPLVLTLMTSSAAAAQADCKSLYLIGMTLHYKTAAVFPATSEDKDLYFLDDENPAKAQTICGVTLTPDKKTQSLQMSAASWSAFKPYFAGSLSGAKGAELVINNPNTVGGSLGEKHHLIFDPVKRALSYLAPRDGFFPLVVGTKVDQGSLKPLLFKDKLTPLNYNAANSILDIYVKPDQAVNVYWQRARIDLKKYNITFYKKAAMPNK